MSTGSSEFWSLFISVARPSEEVGLDGEVDEVIFVEFDCP